jgi:hypothetical protein
VLGGQAQEGLIEHVVHEHAGRVMARARVLPGRLSRGAVPLGVRGFVHHLGDVQQRLRGDAAAVETNAAGVLFFVDERDLHAQVSRVKGRGIAAWPRAKYCNLCCLRH